MTEAAKSIDSIPSTLSKAASPNNKYNTIKGYRWSYEKVDNLIISLLIL
jgi:hypothetical protein